MRSIRANIIRFVSKQMFKRISPDSDVNAVRETFVKASSGRRIASGVATRDAKIADVDCLWLIPEGCEDAPILYYLHGGAHILGSPTTPRQLVSYIARSAKMRALLPDYSLGPEKPFPAGLEDCLAVYREMLLSGQDASRITIGGDSAGGGMTMAVLLSLRDAGHQLPDSAVLLSPWLDLTGSGESAKTRAGIDPWFRPDEMVHAARMYRPEGDLEDPLVSPVFGDMTGLPPIYVQVGDEEILLSDSTRLRDKVEAAGGELTLDIWPEMWHVFQFFVRQMPESIRAVRDIAIFLKRRFGIFPAE